MTQSSSPVEYERLERQLASADLEFSAAEVHGVICGLLCAAEDDPLQSWFAELFEGDRQDDRLADECRATLRKLYAHTLEEMDGAGLGFSMFLPDDARPLEERGRALGEWCRGFMYGLAITGPEFERMLSAEAREALQDITEMTRIDVDSLQDDEEEEDALVEVVEFIWVAAMLIREELLHAKGKAQ